MVKRHMVGLTEKVTIKGKKVIARIDTGARRCSIDKELADDLKLGPIIDERKYRSAAGHAKRPVVREEIHINDTSITVLLNISLQRRKSYQKLLYR